MKEARPSTVLFLDVGGVLLTDGWGHQAREKAASTFSLDLAELNDRHQLILETFELGKFTLEQYLKLVIFYRDRTFSKLEFKKFMFDQSKQLPGMIGYICKLKAKYGLKIVVVSNEGRELNEYRIQEFKLDGFVDSFISSCYVHIRKPDEDIFRLALDINQTKARDVVYIENTAMYIQVAEGLGIRSILHTDYRSTCAQLAFLGLEVAE